MVIRVSKAIQRYAGKDIAVGESFDVHINNVKLLLAIGRIEPEPGEPGFIVRNVAASVAPALSVAVVVPETQLPEIPNTESHSDIQDSVSSKEIAEGSAGEAGDSVAEKKDEVAQIATTTATKKVAGTPGRKKKGAAA